MARIEGVGGTNKQQVEDNGSAAVHILNRKGARKFHVSDITGTIAAALAANSSVFGMRLDPGSAVNAYITRVMLRYTTIVAYTTPITAGRRLALQRFSGAAMSGGTAIAAVSAADSNYTGSEFNTANGGDVRIATTGALTVTGVTFEGLNFGVETLVHVGAAGAYIQSEYEWDTSQGGPVVLRPGQGLCVRNPAAMDAAGTWQLGVTVHGYEAAEPAAT